VKCLLSSTFLSILHQSLNILHFHSDRNSPTPKYGLNELKALSE
jgi:hypothetical protein